MEPQLEMDYQRASELFVWGVALVTLLFTWFLFSNLYYFFKRRY